MPDSVKIGIESSYNGAGVSKAVSDMQRLETAGKGVSGAMFSATGVTQGWSQAQYTAAFNAERLANRANYLEQQVRSGRMTTDQATAAWRGYSAEAKRAEWQAMTFGERYKTVSGIVNSGAKQIMTGVAQFGAMAAGMAFAGKQVYELGKAGATIDYTSEKFDRLARSVGSTGTLFLGQLRTATRGTVSDFELLRQGSDLLQLGLAKDTKEATRLSGVMTALGMDTGEMTLALANQSKRRLDQLGLSLTKFNEIEANLKDSGMSKEDAFKEAFLQTAEQTVMTTGNRADSAMSPFLQLEAAGANVWDNMKQSTASAISPDVQNFANFFKAMSAVQNGEMAWGGNLFEIMSGKTPALISGQQNLANLAQEQWMTNNTTATYTGRGQSTYNRPNAPSAAEFLYEDAAVRRNNATAAMVTSQEQVQTDYAGMLSGGQELTRMTEQYASATAQLNEKLSDERGVLDDMIGKYGEHSDKVAEQREKIADLEGDITGLSDSMTTAAEQFALGALQMQGATDEQQYRFAHAAGLITDDAMEMYEAQNKLAEAYTGGQLSAEAYASGVGMLQNLLAGMDGMQVNAYVDVWVRQHGGGAYLGPLANTTTTNAAIEDLRQDTGGGRWTGGPLTDGFTVVGDAPGGAWTPTTEVIYGDHVFNAEESRALKNAGLLDGATYLSGGTAGQGPGRRNGGGRNGGGGANERGGRRGRGTRSSSTMPAGSTSDDIALTAADVANQAVNVSQQTAAQTQAVAGNIESSTAQTVQAQQETQAVLADKLDTIADILKRQPTVSDTYNIARSAQQMSI